MVIRPPIELRGGTARLSIRTADPESIAAPGNPNKNVNVGSRMHLGFNKLALVAIGLLVFGPLGPLGSSGLLSSSPAHASDKICKVESLMVAPGETRSGDLYFIAQNVDISGQYDGDLIGVSPSAIIAGVVDGDIAMSGSTMDIRGEVRDSVRYFGQTLTITGKIDGDVLFFGAQLNIHPRAEITGSIMAYGGSAFIEGNVGGDVTFGGGHASVTGPIAGNVEIKADTVRVADTAEVQGDFVYISRKRIEIPEGSVMGAVSFKEPTKPSDDDEEEESSAFMTLGGFLKWGWWTLAALLVGLVAIALVRRAPQALVAPIHREGMLVPLVGLGVFLVVPAASVLAILLIISLPLGFIALSTFFIGLYLAKLPVAIWLGQRILGLAGMAAPSPFLALAIGLVLLYALFEIPFFIGTLIYLVTVWLGLGTFVLSARTYFQSRVASEPPAA